MGGESVTTLSPWPLKTQRKHDLYITVREAEKALVGREVRQIEDAIVEVAADG